MNKILLILCLFAIFVISSFPIAADDDGKIMLNIKNGLSNEFKGTWEIRNSIISGYDKIGNDFEYQIRILLNPDIMSKVEMLH